MKIAIASDHGGFKQKSKIIKYLNKKCNIIDLGTNNQDSVDYPDYAKKVCEKVIKKEVNLGVVICKTGIGMNIAANKFKGIRCAKPCNKHEAKMSKLHNDANVLALSGNMPFYKVKGILKEFINNDFSNDERHVKRIKKLNDN
jgi:ribose 5-phosphate isomerase B